MIMGKGMKTLLVSYYARNNLGDDLFIFLLAEKFSDCQIKLICRSRYFSSDFPDNVRISFFSYIEYLYFLFQHFIKIQKIEKYIGHAVYSLRSKIASRCDAFVEIGGSIYMDRSGEPVDFMTNFPPHYEWKSVLSEKGNTFVIGANLGPASSDKYWEKIRSIFLEKNIFVYGIILLTKWFQIFLMSNMLQMYYSIFLPLSSQTRALRMW